MMRIAVLQFLWEKKLDPMCIILVERKKKEVKSVEISRANVEITF